MPSAVYLALFIILIIGLFYYSIKCDTSESFQDGNATVSDLFYIFKDLRFDDESNQRLKSVMNPQKMGRTYPTYAPVVDSRPTYTPVVESRPTYAPVVDSRPTYAPVVDSRPTYTPVVESRPTYTPVVESRPTYAPKKVMRTVPTISPTTSPKRTTPPPSISRIATIGPAQPRRTLPPPKSDQEIESSVRQTLQHMQNRTSAYVYVI
jgi:hypothetical protein